jgi:hypothetical protein
MYLAIFVYLSMTTRIALKTSYYCANSDNEVIKSINRLLHGSFSIGNTISFPVVRCWGVLVF